MPLRVLVDIAEIDVREHPAALAWHELTPSEPPPRHIEVLRERANSSIYRLKDVGVGGGAVMAKRARGEPAQIERYLYECVLPSLPLSLPRFYGGVATPEGSSWIFLEDVGAKRYAPADPDQRARASEWLAWMHVSAATLPAAARLPDAGPVRHLRHLRAAREAVRHLRASPMLPADEAPCLETLLSTLHLAEACWDRLESCCAGVPVTLVHGDLRPRHIHVQRDLRALRVFPLDWQSAGWGLPAADLSQVDVETYTSVIREHWPGIDLRIVARVAQAGRVFQVISALGRAIPETPGRALATIRVLAARLSDALAATGVRTR